MWLTPADRAWLTLAGGIVAYDLAWYYAPVEQAEHCTDGLLNAATALRQEAQA